MDIEAGIRTIISQFTDFKPDQIKLDNRLVEDFGLDSLDLIEVCMVAEDDFEVDIPEADAATIVTPRDAIEYVRRAIAAKR